MVRKAVNRFHVEGRDKGNRAAVMAVMTENSGSDDAAAVAIDGRTAVAVVSGCITVCWKWPISWQWLSRGYIAWIGSSK